jgi:FkbM family methyltransferase
MRRESKRLSLALRKSLGNDGFVDYGWIRLPYSGDRDWQEVYYHLNQEAWHGKDAAVLRNLVLPGSTVVDVGANLGFITAILSDLVGPAGRVVSFEPSRATFAKLCRVIEANDLDNVTPINEGCGAEAGFLKLKAVGGSSGSASLIAPGVPAETIEVVRLDDVPELAEREISLIKIDTEGFEPYVLEGARDLVMRDRPVLYLEMGGDFMESTHRSIEVLQDLDYDVRHVLAVDWARFGNGNDFFFMPRERRS